MGEHGQELVLLPRRPLGLGAGGLLGLEMIRLDDCEGGPITVDIGAVPGGAVEC